MNTDPEVKTRTTAFLVLLAALLVVCAGFLGFFRDYPDFFSGKKEPVVEVSRDIVEKWRNAVLSDDRKNAFLYASQIVPDRDFELPDAVYTEFFEICGQPPSVLTSTWTDSDFSRWKSWLAQTERISGEEDLDSMLSALQKAEPGDLFDLAALSGFDVFVVRVLNSDPPQELYEFRRNGTVCTMSPSDRKFVKGTAKEILPEAELIHLYPAPLADYRQLNQKLYRRVEPYLGRMPRPPAEILVERKEKYPDIGAIAFWPDPIRPIGQITVKK